MSSSDKLPLKPKGKINNILAANRRQGIPIQGQANSILPDQPKTSGSQDVVREKKRSSLCCSLPIQWIDPKSNQTIKVFPKNYEVLELWEVRFH